MVGKAACFFSTGRKWGGGETGNSAFQGLPLMSMWSLAMNLSVAEHWDVSIFLVTTGVNKASDGAEQKGIPQQGARAASPGDGLRDLAAGGPQTDGRDGRPGEACVLSTHSPVL